MRARPIINSGLATGLILGIIDGIVSGWWLAADVAERLARSGLSISPLLGPYFIGADFLLGIITMWLYVAIQPRFKPEPRTAIIAALIVFLLVRLIGFGHVVSGEETIRFYLFSAFGQLAGLVTGALIGAKLLRSSES